MTDASVLHVSVSMSAFGAWARCSVEVVWERHGHRMGHRPSRPLHPDERAGLRANGWTYDRGMRAWVHPNPATSVGAW